MKIDKSGMMDSMKRYTTQSLFWEIGNDINSSVYTLRDEDIQVQGKKLISIKKAFIDARDPTEYEFAKTYFLGWKHWQRLLGNQRIAREVEAWRDELEVALRADAYKGIAGLAVAGDFKSLKWVAERGWDIKKAGRPSKAEMDRQKRIQQNLDDEYSDDIKRLRLVHGAD
jgi:hypothetical protein